MRLGRATASAPGRAVNSVSALARMSSLTSGSASGGGGSGVGWRKLFGMKLANLSAKSHPQSAAMAQAMSITANIFAGMAATVARLRGAFAKAAGRASQLGREPRMTLRVGERHWQP